MRPGLGRRSTSSSAFRPSSASSPWGRYLTWRHLRSAKLKVFRPHLSEFTRTPQPKVEGTPYRTGRILAVDVGRCEVDEDVHFELPEDLRARTPEEVGTVAWVKWGTRAVGKYTDGATASSYTCTLTVIDRAKWTIIHEEEMGGPGPPSQRKSTESATGAKPTWVIVEYLKTLPSR